MKTIIISVLAITIVLFQIGGTQRHRVEALIVCTVWTNASNLAQNGSVFTVKRGDIQRLQCQASAKIYDSIIVDTAYQPMAFTEFLDQSRHNRRIHTHYFSITNSGMVLIHGLNRATGNTDYTIILYFTVDDGPTQATTLMTNGPDTVQDNVSTGKPGSDTRRGEEVTRSSTTSDVTTISTANSTMVDLNTFIGVIIVLALTLIIISLVAILVTVAMAIHYRRLQQTLHKSKQTDADMTNNASFFTLNTSSSSNDSV